MKTWFVGSLFVLVFLHLSPTIVVADEASANMARTMAEACYSLADWEFENASCNAWNADNDFTTRIFNLTIGQIAACNAALNQAGADRTSALAAANAGVAKIASGDTELAAGNWDAAQEHYEDAERDFCDEWAFSVSMQSEVDTYWTIVMMPPMP